MIVPSTLPTRYPHHCGGTATQIAKGPPVLVHLGDPRRTPTAADIYWRERYACDGCGEVITLYEDLHVAVIVPARDLLRPSAQHRRAA